MLSLCVGESANDKEANVLPTSHDMIYLMVVKRYEYRNISNIKRTKSQNLNVSRLGLKLTLRNIFKPSVKWRRKM